MVTIGDVHRLVGEEFGDGDALVLVEHPHLVEDLFDDVVDLRLTFGRNGENGGNGRVGSAGERDRRGGGAHLLEMAAEQLGPVGTNVLVGQDTAVVECIDGECPDDTQLGVARVGEAVGEEGSVVGGANASASRMVVSVSAPRRRSSASSASSPGARSSADRVTPR